MADGAALRVKVITTPTDFNDLGRLEGPEAVRLAVAAAQPVAPAPLCPDAIPSDLDTWGHLSVIALDIGDLLARDFPAKDLLLTPWLRRQDLAMVHAWRGVGKTYFALGVAYAVAGGGSFLGWEAPRARKVLYLDGEMPGAAIKERLAAIVEGAAEDHEPPEGCFRIVTPDAQAVPIPDLSTARGQEALAAVIGDAELIVVDNLSAWARSGVENEGESWLPIAGWALRMRREGRAVLFVHHAGKNGAQRGTSRREDLLDVVLKLKHPGDYRAEEGARFEIHFEKARGLFGEAVRSIEATLTRDGIGKEPSNNKLNKERHALTIRVWKRTMLSRRNSERWLIAWTRRRCVSGRRRKHAVLGVAA